MKWLFLVFAVGCAPVYPDPCESDDWPLPSECLQPICWQTDTRIRAERELWSEYMSYLDFCKVEEIPECARTRGEWATEHCEEGK